MYICMYIYRWELLFCHTENKPEQSCPVRPLTWAWYGTHIELHMEFHVEIHTKLHMDHHMELHMHLHMGLHMKTHVIWNPMWNSIWASIWISIWKSIWDTIWASTVYDSQGFVQLCNNYVLSCVEIGMPT